MCSSRAESNGASDADAWSKRKREKYIAYLEM